MNSSFLAFHVGMACGFLVDSFKLIDHVTWDPIIAMVLSLLAASSVLFGAYQLVTEGRK
jgi:hypothetical protein